jgi:hypothetical protein
LRENADRLQNSEAVKRKIKNGELLVESKDMSEGNCSSGDEIIEVSMIQEGKDKVEHSASG